MKYCFSEGLFSLEHVEHGRLSVWWQKLKDCSPVGEQRATDSSSVGKHVVNRCLLAEKLVMETPFC